MDKELTKQEERCPYLRVHAYHDEEHDEVYEGWSCTETGKFCLLEIDQPCKIYNEWKEEQDG